MYNMPGDYASAMDRSAMLQHYCRMYPRAAMDLYPHVHAVAEEMDDAGNVFMPKERFDAMVDRVMSRMDDGWWMDDDPEFDPRRRRFRFPRRRELTRALIAALLIGEILRRRRFFVV